MYASHHAAVGTPMVLYGATFGPVGIAAGFVLAVISHLFVDMIGEKGYGPLLSKETLFWEGVPFIGFAIAAWLSGQWWLFALGWVGSLLPDLIDKPLTWLGKSSLWICHTKPGWVKFPLTLTQTKVTAVLATLSYFLLLFI